MSRHAVFAALAALVLASCLPAAELLTNGDFELDPSHGWVFTTWGEYPDTGNCRLRWGHWIHPDRDCEVSLLKTLNQGMSLCQEVPVANPDSVDLKFDVSCRLTSRSGAMSCWSAAAVGLQYVGELDSVLGEARIYVTTPGCLWENGPTLHLIPAPDSLNWHDYRIDVDSELANLPGVAPYKVRALRVVLLSFVYDNS